MADARAVRNAKARRQRLLNSEEYGPKYARLNAGDSKIVDELIFRNRMDAARTAILNLDKARREQRRTRAQLNRRIMEDALRYADLPRSQRIGAGRPDDKQALFWHTYDGVAKNGAWY